MMKRLLFVLAACVWTCSITSTSHAGCDTPLGPVENYITLLSDPASGTGTLGAQLSIHNNSGFAAQYTLTVEQQLINITAGMQACIGVGSISLPAPSAAPSTCAPAPVALPAGDTHVVLITVAAGHVAVVRVNYVGVFNPPLPPILELDVLYANGSAGRQKLERVSCQ